jgi:transcriptional regulator with XRE-family HTH domain
MTQPILAERVGVSVPTIGKLEDGDPSTSFATVIRVLAALGMSQDIDLLAADDALGRSLQDNQLRRPPPSFRESVGSERGSRTPSRQMKETKAAIPASPKTKKP